MLRGALICLIWELLVAFSPAQSRVPHLWQAYTSIESFARFGDYSGNGLAAGTKVLMAESLRSLFRASAGMCLGAVAGYILGAGALLVPGWQAVPVKIIACFRAIPPLALVSIGVPLSNSRDCRRRLYRHLLGTDGLWILARYPALRPRTTTTTGATSRWKTVASA
jgi:ABC-type nitrate/sulfonate/bicarbonate transport system permease component